MRAQAGALARGRAAAISNVWEQSVDTPPANRIQEAAPDNSSRAVHNRIAEAAPIVERWSLPKPIRRGWSLAWLLNQERWGRR